MARVLGLSTREFTKKYCEKTEGWIHLKNPDQTCRFLKGKRCSVYEGRPAQCRTWPFWPENMNAKTWNTEVVGFCAGIGKGRLYTAAEIRKRLKLDPIR
jgi:Fe-S-cluster containining protein